MGLNKVILRNQYIPCVGPKVCSGFSRRCYGKTRTHVVANPNIMGSQRKRSKLGMQGTLSFSVLLMLIGDCLLGWLGGEKT